MEDLTAPQAKQGLRMADPRIGAAPLRATSLKRLEGVPPATVAALGARSVGLLRSFAGARSRKLVRFPG